MSDDVTWLHVSAACAPPSIAEDADMRFCCDAEAYRGPQYCTCWTLRIEVYEQGLPWSVDLPGKRALRCCGDCAYKPGSPEREEDVRLPTTEDHPFYCHVGMPKAIGWEHPDGTFIPLEPEEGDAYMPVYVWGIPYTKNGMPAELCAGWAAVARPRGLR